MPCPCDSGLPCDQQSCEGAAIQPVNPLTCDVPDCPCGICEQRPAFHLCNCGLIGGNCDCAIKKEYQL
jgi:hypothetical protein